MKGKVMGTRHLRLAMLVVAGVLCAPAFADGTVSLRSVARLSGDGPVLLKDVADLEGPDALALADAVVLERAVARTSGSRWVELDIAEVQAKLKAHDAAAVARVVVRGRSCAVMAAPAAIEPAAAPEAVVPTRFAAGTVGEAVERTIAETLQVEVSDVRCTFAPADQELLGRARGDWVLDIRVCGSSARLPLAIKAFEGERLVLDTTIRAEVAVRRHVVLASVPVSRGERVAIGTFATAEQWLAPSVRPVEPADAFGQELRSSLPAGSVVEDRHLMAAMVMARGDVAVVHVVSGTVLIEEHARALKAGRVGDVIDFEATDGSRRRLRARVEGPGRAVVSTSEVRS